MVIKSQFLSPKSFEVTEGESHKNRYVCIIYMVVNMWQQGEHMGVPAPRMFQILNCGTGVERNVEPIAFVSEGG